MTDQQLLLVVRMWRPTVTQPMEWYQYEERNQSMKWFLCLNVLPLPLGTDMRTDDYCLIIYYLCIFMLLKSSVKNTMCMIGLVWQSCSRNGRQDARDNYLAGWLMEFLSCGYRSQFFSSRNSCSLSQNAFKILKATPWISHWWEHIILTNKQLIATAWSWLTPHKKCWRSYRIHAVYSYKLLPCVDGQQNSCIHPMPTKLSKHHERCRMQWLYHQQQCVCSAHDV